MNIKYSIYFLLTLSLINCNDKKDSAIDAESLSETDSIVYETSPSIRSLEEIPTMNNWLNFYKIHNPEFSLGNFELQKTEKLETMTGSVSGKFDPEFDSTYEPFLIYNPSKTFYIDLDSYHWTLDGEGNPMFEADQEVNLVNLNDQSVSRIAFYGPSYWAEDAFWLTDSVFVILVNNDENLPGFQLFNLEESSVTSYGSSQPLNQEIQDYRKERFIKKGIGTNNP